MLRRLAALTAPLLAALAAAVPPAAAADPQACPEQSFLHSGHLVYASVETPAGVSVQPGSALPEGEVDRPRGIDPCKRERVSIALSTIAGVDEMVAVVAADGAGPVFVLGSRCAGYDEAGLWACLLGPLVLDGTPYTGIRYPDGNASGELEAAEPLGEATIGGETVTAVAIAGVPASTAVLVRERPGEVFVAPGVCPYEGPSSDPAADDLARCILGPLWFAYDPVGARPGEEIKAYGDRPVPAELEGAAVGLVRLSGTSDVLPEGAAVPEPLGTITRGGDGGVVLELAAPDLPFGPYETVIDCAGCSEAYGATRFAAGSVIVLEAREGSSSFKIVYIVLFALVIILIAAAVVFWRRGYSIKLGRRRT